MQVLQQELNALAKDKDEFIRDFSEVRFSFCLYSLVDLSFTVFVLILSFPLPHGFWIIICRKITMK
jgi:hypothetical protein